MDEKAHGSVASHSVMLEKYDQRNMQNYCVHTFYAFFSISHSCLPVNSFSMYKHFHFYE